MTGERCTGHCCTMFPLSGSYEYLEASYRVHVLGEMPKDNSVVARINDIETIFPMVEKVGVDDRGVQWYRCNNLQPNGDCGIYERRPQMCKTYPEGKPCRWIWCTSAAARKGAECVAR